MGKRKGENPSSRSTSSPPAPGHKSRKRRKRGRHLPRDVWWDILVRFPAKSLVRFRSVCKAWRSVIDDPFFADKQHQITSMNNNNNTTILISTSSTAPPFAPFYLVDLDALKPTKPLQSIPATPAHLPLLPRHRYLPLATCHGLMFLNYEIWNPLFFGDRLKLPRQGGGGGGDGFTLPHRDNLVVGLGYDCSTDDYKAVVIDRGTYGEPQLPFPTYVYSLRSGGSSWRRIGDCPFGDDDHDFRDWGPGVYLNGALHWVSAWYDGIVALDLETEEYRKLQTPPFFWDCDEELVIERSREIDVLDGCLVVTDFCKDDYCSLHFDAWALEEPGGSWTKLFSLGDTYAYEQIPSMIRPVAYMKNKRHIFMQQNENFYLVDTKTNILKRVSIVGLTAGNYLTAQLFQQTLIRPKHFCGGVVGPSTGEAKKRKRKTRMMEKCNTGLCFSQSDLTDLDD